MDPNIRFYCTFSVPDQTVLENAKRKLEERVREQEETQTSTSANQQEAAFEVTNQNSAPEEGQEDVRAEKLITQAVPVNNTTVEEDSFAIQSEVPIISANQNIASSESINQIAPASKSSVQLEETQKQDTVIALDVSDKQLNCVKSRKNSETFVEMDNVTVDMEAANKEANSLFSINPFVIPVKHLIPFQISRDMILKLDKKRLDKILVNQKSRKGSGPLPLSAYKNLKLDWEKKEWRL